MSEGWYKIELPDDLRTRPLPDAVFQVRHEFLQRYDTTLNKPNGALLLANFDLDRPEQVLPRVLFNYLSLPAVRMLQHLLLSVWCSPVRRAVCRGYPFYCWSQTLFFVAPNR